MKSLHRVASGTSQRRCFGKKLDVLGKKIAILEKIGCFGMRNQRLSLPALFNLIQWVREAEAQLKGSSHKVKGSGRRKYFQLEGIFLSQGPDL